MEALAFSMIVLTCLWLTLFKSSTAVLRSFNSSIRQVLFSSMVCCLVLCGGVSGIGVSCLVFCSGVSGIGVSRPSYGSVVLLGGVGSITGVAVGGGGSGVPATTVPYFSLFWVSVSSGREVLLLVSRALVGHGVCSALFLASVCDLGHPACRLGAGGAGFSCSVGGVRIIVLPPFLPTVVGCFTALMARVLV